MIKFDLFSEEDQKFTDKYSAYISSEKKSVLHRHESYKVQFNDNPKFPIIENLKLIEK